MRSIIGVLKERYQNLKKLRVQCNEPINLHIFQDLQGRLEDLEIPSVVKTINGQSIKVVPFNRLTRLRLESIDETIAMELFSVLERSDTLKELEVNYPFKYQELHPIGRLIEVNRSLERLKLTKVKPLNFHFLKKLHANTTLKTI